MVSSNYFRITFEQVNLRLTPKEKAVIESRSRTKGLQGHRRLRQGVGPGEVRPVTLNRYNVPRYRVNERKANELAALKLQGGLSDFRGTLGRALALPPQKKWWPSADLVRKANKYRGVG